MSQKSQCHYKPVLEVSTTARNTLHLLLASVIPILLKHVIRLEARRDRLEQCKSILDVLKVMKMTGLHRVYYGELYELYRIFRYTTGDYNIL